ncbi:MAG: BatA and WFA domain-containing protein [bacterium]|nr:BatA and WFA domain-containing protein [bacterium]
MGFLQPLFLWGIAGVSIPVLIHLFSRRKSPPYYFSTLRFIKLTRKKTIRRQKLEEILILLLRAILIAFLFIAAAQPVSKRALFREKESWVILVLDDSASMSSLSGYAWKNLQRASEQILASLNKQTHVAVIFTGGKIIPFSIIHQDIAKKIRESQPGFHGNTLQNAIEQAFSMLDKKSGYLKIFVITDMQKSGWKNFSSATFKKINPDITIIDAGGEEKPVNLTLKDFYPLSGKAMYVGEIINWNDREITAEIKITGDDFEVTKSVTVSGKKTGEFEVKPDKDSQSFKVEILYSDDLKPDNYFYYQKERGAEKKVLLAGSDDTSVFYIKSSVQSTGTITVDIRKTNEFQDIFLGKYRTILMVNPQKIEQNIREKIIEYIVDGGTLIYFAGDRITSEDFNRDWTIEGKNEFLMPAKIAEKSEFLRPGKVAWVAAAHPLFAEFGEKTIDYLKTTRFNACFPIREITGDILMKLDNGYPLLLEKKIGKGRIFLFTFNVHRQWTNFQNKPFFPVMMSMLVEYLSGYTNSISVGDSVIVKGTENADSVSVINPMGEKIIIKNTEKKAVSYIPDIPGIWTAIFSDKEGEQRQCISANIPWQEGDFSKISYGEIRTIFKKNRISFVSSGQMEKLILTEVSSGKLMMVFLNFALGLLLSELILSNVLVFLKQRIARDVKH